MTSTFLGSNGPETLKRARFGNENSVHTSDLLPSNLKVGNPAKFIRKLCANTHRFLGLKMEMPLNESLYWSIANDKSW